jgi:hypothetical protein
VSACAASISLARIPTASSRPYCNVQCRNKVGENGIYLIQSSQDIDDIGTRVRIFFRKDRGKEGRGGLILSASFPTAGTQNLTSRACASAGAVPALMHATALENSCRVCTYTRIKTGSPCNSLCQPRTWRCNKSSGLRPCRIRCNEVRSGFNRKNSLQKPSDLSGSSSSCRHISGALSRLHLDGLPTLNRDP